MPRENFKDPDLRGTLVRLPDQRNMVREPFDVATKRTWGSVRVAVVVDQYVSNSESVDQACDRVGVG
jgi:hypothetical protein